MPLGSQSFWKKLRRTRADHSRERSSSQQSATNAKANVDASAQLHEQVSQVSDPNQSTFSTGRFGLELVQECPPPMDGRRSFPVDIVFVHGLNGDIKSTWTHENGTFWPEDLLPAMVPGARIFSFGYDSKIFFSTSNSEYRDFALGLLRDLNYLGSSTGKVQPLVFVCHSLGGIVVKEAVNVAYDREDHEVLNRSKGIVFLGTPHRGSDVAGPAAVLGNILSAVWSSVSFVVPGPRTKLISDLERSSKVLFAIGDRFVGRTNSIEITSFYETNVTPPTRKVIVDENSGVLGLKNERRYPLFRNHRDICRFESRESADYRAVTSAICEIVTRIVPLRQGSESQQSLTNSEKECIQNLNTIDLIDFEYQIDKRSPNTLLWLSKDIQYTNWLTNASTSLLLVTGYAGCGKTVLASYVRASLPVDPATTCLVCRFYCNAKDEKMHSAVELIRSLIHQIVENSHEMLRAVVKAASRDQWLWGSFERLWALFENIVTSDKVGETIIIIDAIDELEERIQRQMTARILSLMRPELASSIKLFITSQPQASAVTDLRDYSLRLALETKYDLISDDVNLFIQARVKDLVTQKGWSSGFQRRLTTTLQSNAGQSFLWVALTLSFLEQRDILSNTDLEDALATIPPGLTEFYDRCLKLMTTRNSPGPALRLLNMVLSSLRPLQVDELEVLLSIDQSHESMAEVRRNYAISGVQSIQQVLGPLVRCYRSRIQLVHSTLREHLTNSGGAYGIEERLGHEILAERCIRFLLLRDSRAGSLDTIPSPVFFASREPSLVTRARTFDEDNSSDIQGSAFQALFSEPEDLHSLNFTTSQLGHELRDYATRYWAVHFEKSQASETSQAFILAQRLYTSFGALQWEDVLRCVTEAPEEYPSQPDPLTLASYYGHYRIAENFLRRPSVSDYQIGRALYWSASRGHAQCVELISSFFKPCFDKHLCYVTGQSPLAAAAANGHLDTVRFLLNTGLFMVNEPDNKGLTPLSLAANRSREEVVSTLLSLDRSKGLDPNIADKNGRSALFWACRSNSRKIVEELLRDERVDVNLLDIRQESALSWACEYGFADIVRHFVNNKAVILGAQNYQGYTPLILAIKWKDWKTVKCLFRRRSNGDDDELNIAAKDREGRNAISWAARAGDRRILETLLHHSHGEATVQDDNGWSPLAWTMDPPGFPQNAMLLIPHYRNDINQRDVDGNSLLSTAIRWDSVQVAQLLIETTDIDVNQKNVFGETALHLAAAHGMLDMVKNLVELRGADSSMIDSEGRTPVQYARDRGYDSIANYLESV